MGEGTWAGTSSSCGDVVGRPGRDAVKAHLPEARRALAIDLAIVNAENAAHGFGLTEKICGELYDAGADIPTTGNHAWDQKEIIPYIDKATRASLRPANFPAPEPRGAAVAFIRSATGGRCWWSI